MKVCAQCQEEFADEVDFCPTDGQKLRKMRVDIDPMLGRELDGRWIIHDKIGEGGMGAVYIAQQRSMSRSVAIKTLRKELVESDEFVDRFMREVQVATALNHPHVVTVLDHGQDDDGTLFLVMELLDGVPLTTLLQKGPLAPDDALRIAIQISSALEAAHGMSYVHRDLKPDNIFMINMPGGGIFAKVLDFGIAKVLDGGTKMTKTGMIIGTPAYMSPEQCKGITVDDRSDLYALGCILFEMLGGRTPFRADTPMAVLLAHVGEPPPRPSSFGIEIDPALEDFVMSMLAKEPSERPAGANVVRTRLEQFLAMGATSQNLAPASVGAEEPIHVVPTSSNRPRNVLIVVSVTVALAAVCVAYLALHQAETTEEPAAQIEQAETPQTIAAASPVNEGLDEAAGRGEEIANIAAATSRGVATAAASANAMVKKSTPKKVAKKKPEPAATPAESDTPERVSVKQRTPPVSEPHVTTVDPPAEKEQGKIRTGINKTKAAIQGIKETGLDAKKGLKNTWNKLLD